MLRSGSRSMRQVEFARPRRPESCRGRTSCNPWAARNRAKRWRTEFRSALRLVGRDADLALAVLELVDGVEDLQLLLDRQPIGLAWSPAAPAPARSAPIPPAPRHPGAASRPRQPEPDLELVQRVAIGGHGVDVIVLGGQLRLARLIHVRQPLAIRRPRFQPLGALAPGPGSSCSDCG